MIDSCFIPYNHYIAFPCDSFLIITLFDWRIPSCFIQYNHYIAFSGDFLDIITIQSLYCIPWWFNPHNHYYIWLNSLMFHPIQSLYCISLVIYSSSLLCMIEFPHISSHTITILHFYCDSIHIKTIYNWISIMFHPKQSLYCICLVIYST